MSTKARKEYQRAYYLENRDKILEQSRVNHLRNREFRLQQDRERYERDDVGVILNRARQRAKTRGLPFNLSRCDIIIPDECPVLGLELMRAKGGKAAPNSPSLDRIDPDKGYVFGNVRVISYRANVMKSNASADELRRFAEFVLREQRAA